MRNYSIERRGFLGIIAAAVLTPLKLIIPKSDPKPEIVAILLENQRQMNKNEYPEPLFKQMAVPLYRRHNYTELANQIMHVEPLHGPPGLVYYLNEEFGND
jgi:hypothetical protein